MMSKQSAIILIIVVFLGALGALVWFYFSFTAQPLNLTTITPTTTVSDVYDPFGTKALTETSSSSSTQPLGTTNGLAQINQLSGDKLRQITPEPVSGYSIIDDTKNQTTDIRYVLRANGNIYEAYTNSPEQKRLSITTIPKVYEAVWLTDGMHLIVRYLKDDNESIDTFSIKINPATTTLNEFTGGIDGNHLIENINNLVLNPTGNKLFYLTNNEAGSSGFISSPNGLNSKIIFKSPLVEWLPSWPKEETITLVTKPSSKVPGYLYFLNSQTGTLTRALGGINGLTIKSNPAVSEILYSDSTSGLPKLYLYNIKKDESTLLPWNTLPEKCLWSETDDNIIYCAVPKNFTAGDYPDNWYQGLIGFTDDLWSINTSNFAPTLLSTFGQDTNIKIDAIDLQLDKNDDYLFFTNKTDLSLWSLKLK